MNWIIAKVFDNPIDAHLLKIKLESEGIPCLLVDENTVSLDPLLSHAIGGIKLKVAEKDAERAQEILNALEARPYSDENDEAIHCPKCASTSLHAGFRSMKGYKGILSAFISFLLMVFPLYFKRVYRCRQCGTEFQVRPE